MIPPVRMPSIRTAATEARRVALRFPLVLVAGTAAAVAGSLMLGSGNASRFEPALVAATLGLPLFVALAVRSERIESRLAILIAVAGVLGLVALGLWWSHWTEPIRIRRYAQLSIGLHLLVAFLPYGRGEANAFWQYNRILFLRFLTAALYSAVLYVGLAIALVAVDQLFKVEVHANVFLRLWLWIAFLFNTWFFLGGIPSDLAALEQRHEYPRALKVFSQFILIPLVVVYLAILTTYLVRILVTGQWPSGWIGYLVSSVAAVGILSLLLVHPIRDDPENRWVGVYARWFYVALLPAVGMLLVAIWKRIAQYGVTEDRYFIAILALWLAATAAMFIVRPRAPIRWIPITLCLLAFATTCGPQGAYAVSRRSQTARLRHVLTRQGLLVDGLVSPATSEVPFPARKELSSSVHYLLSVHGPGPVKEVLGDAMPALERVSVPFTTGRERGALGDAQQVLSALGMEYVNTWDSPESRTFNYASWGDPPQAFAVADDDYHVHLPGTMPMPFRVGDRTWLLRKAGMSLELSSIDQDTIRLPLDSLVAYPRFHAGPPRAAPALVGEAAGMRATLVVSMFYGAVKADTVEVGTLVGDLYLKLRKP